MPSTSSWPSGGTVEVGVDVDVDVGVVAGSVTGMVEGELRPGVVAGTDEIGRSLPLDPPDRPKPHQAPIGTAATALARRKRRRV